MMLKPSDAYTAQFTTQHPDTAVAIDADATPTATATRNGTDDGAFNLTVTLIATGRYKITGTVPATYSAGDIIQITVNATVNGTNATAVIDHFQIDTKRNSDLIDFNPTTQSINVGQWAGNNVSSTDFSVLTYLDASISSRSTFDPQSDQVTAENIGTGSDSTDWTDTEKQQIRHRLGIDGDTSLPTNTGDLLDIKTILQAATRK